MVEVRGADTDDEEVVDPRIEVVKYVEHVQNFVVTD